MDSPSPPPDATRPNPPATNELRLAGGFAIGTGLVALIGWSAGIEVLTEWLPQGIPVVRNTAILLILSGLALWLLAVGRRRAAGFLGGVIFLFASATLLSRLFGWFPGLHELFGPAPWGPPDLPRGQTSPNAAVAFLFVGATVVLLAVRLHSRWVLPLFGGMIVAIALLPLLSMASARLVADAVTVYHGMSLPTALCLLFLAWALLRNGSDRDRDSLARSLLATGVGMLVSIGFVTVQTESELIEANGLVAHSHEVRSTLDNFVSEVARMESTVRAYALTGDRFFGQRFEVHRQTLLDDLASVQRVVADHPAQTERGHRLRALAQRKIDQAAGVMAAADAGGPAGAARYLQSLSRNDTSALVTLTDEMRAEEDRLLASRAVGQRFAESNTHIVQGVGVFLALGLLASALITARRAAAGRQAVEFQLQRREEQLRLLVENVHDYAFFLLDPHGFVETWHEGAARLLGYTAAEAIGKDSAEFFPAPDRAAGAPAQLLAAALATGRHAGQAWRVRKDGTNFLADFVVLPLRGERGQLLGFAKTIHDVTERTRAENAVRESEERFRHAFEDAGVGMALVAIDGRWLRVNRVLCDIVGYTAEELLRTTFQTITHPADLERDLGHVRGLLEGRERSYRIEKRYLHRDGHVVWINLTVSLVRDAAGGPVHFISQIEDITWRKQLETDLRQARDEALAAEADLAAINRLHRAVLDGNEFSIIATGPNGVITVFSAGAEKMLGYTADEMVGRLTPEVLHLKSEIQARARELADQLGTSVEPGFEALVALARRGRTDERELTYVRKDGSHIPVRLSVTALRDDAGGIKGFMGIAQDLTQRKKAEHALQASEERLRRVLARADCLVWQAQVAIAGDDWEWQFAVQPSAMYRRLFGTETPDENAGLWYLFDIPEMSEMNRRSREAILDGRPGYEQEFRLLRDGRETWIHESVSIQRSEPGVASLVGVAIDITERKRLEESLAQARDDALGASRLKSEFLATMSHEFRTPMNGVLGMVDLLAQTNLDADQREMLRIARASTESLLVLIEDILDFSRLEAAKLRINPVAFELVPVLEETLGLLAPRAEEKGVELVGDFDPELAGAFRGDAARIRQIITNLAGNAVKFTERGEVVVFAGLEAVAGREPLVRIGVRDTGIGIAPEAHAELFQAFKQVDGSTTRRFGGTGLGLAISRQLVGLMGGDIGFTSEPGRGSEFWFRLPLPRVSPARPPRIVGAGRHVLVVEGNDTARRVLLAQLQRTGVTAVGVPGGPAALSWLHARRLAGEPADAILIATRLPGLTGGELAEALRSDPALAVPPLVLLAPPGARLEPSARWAAALTKPVQEASLFDALERVWHGGKPSAARREAAPSVPRDGRRILVVEDNASNQIVARMMLERLGCVVEIVSGGAPALQRLARRPAIDLVLMDCQMPGMDGYETCRRIRAGNVPGIDPKIPIVALTAYAMPEDREKCLAAGMNDFLTKPIDADALRKALARDFTAAPPASAAPSPDEEIFDRQTVAVLRDLPGRTSPSLWIEMIALFCEQEDDWLAELDQLAAARDAVELAELSHRLAGACASVGARQMRLTSLAVERAVRAGDWPLALRSLEALRTASGRLHEALDTTRAEEI